MLVYTISKGTNKSYVYDIYRGVKGDKGDAGPQGSQGIQGPQGEAATIQVGSVTAGPTASIVNSGTSSAAVFDFVLPRGEQGEQGPVGQAAGFGTPTASASTLSAGSDATVSVTASGDSTQKVFSFSFGIPEGPRGETGPQGPMGPTGATGPQGSQGIQGETGPQGPIGPMGPTGAQGPQGSQGIQGETGPQGPTGATGPAAGFGTPTATISSITGSTPTVSVTASGQDTAKVFSFDFGIPESGGGDVWEVSNIHYESSSYPNTIYFKVYKNKQLFTENLYTKINQYPIDYTSVVSEDLALNYSSAMGMHLVSVNGVSNKTSFFDMDIFTDSARTNRVYSCSFTRVRKAASIASGENGLVTGDQVYQVVGDVETLLAAL